MLWLSEAESPVSKQLSPCEDGIASEWELIFAAINGGWS